MKCSYLLFSLDFFWNSLLETCAQNKPLFSSFEWWVKFVIFRMRKSTQSVEDLPCFHCRCCSCGTSETYKPCEIYCKTLFFRLRKSFLLGKKSCICGTWLQIFVEAEYILIWGWIRHEVDQRNFSVHLEVELMHN